MSSILISRAVGSHSGAGPSVAGLPSVTGLLSASVSSAWAYAGMATAQIKNIEEKINRINNTCILPEVNLAKWYSNIRTKVNPKQLQK
jgi:hypothetical protein